jgi:hypothetical protein
MAARVFISYRTSDGADKATALARDLDALFGEQQIFLDKDDLPAGSRWRDEIARTLHRSPIVLVLVTPNYFGARDSEGKRCIERADDPPRDELEAALAANAEVIPLMCDGVTAIPSAADLPKPFDELCSRTWRKLRAYDWREDLSRLARDLQVLGVVPRATSDEVGSPPLPAAAKIGTPRSSKLSLLNSLSAIALLPLRVVDAAKDWLATIRKPIRVEPNSADPGGAGPLTFGTSAPSHCTPGDEFSLVVAAYIPSRRDESVRQMRSIGGPSHSQLLDLAPNTATDWAVGTPFTVRPLARHFTIEPAEITFQWNGHRTEVAFSVSALGVSPRTAVIGVQVMVADISILFIPLQVTIEPTARSRRIDRQPGPAATTPRSAFASYSSKDAPSVLRSLSTLCRWSPSLDIFLDCLDLKPNEEFKPDLARQIAKRDVFILFWSRSAASSIWVRWEYETALQVKGANAIVPMPLEDPSIAPPPPEFTDEHMRDRFLLAGYGLAKIAELRASS